MRPLRVLNVGRMGYLKACKLQKAVCEEVRSKQSSDTIIIVQHDPVYTVGLRDKMYSTQEENKLKTLGADFCRTNRGGLITFHGPGQLVVYPIMDLRNYKPSVRWYVCQLEKTIIKLCETYGIHAYTSPHTGVWVNDMKICALGIHASRYITTHGLALNCNTDLEWFRHIVPCGIQGKTVTSLTQQLGRTVSVQEVTSPFIQIFSEQFQCQDLQPEVQVLDTISS